MSHTNNCLYLTFGGVCNCGHRALDMTPDLIRERLHLLLLQQAEFNRKLTRVIDLLEYQFVGKRAPDALVPPSEIDGRD